jgi:hypothetical protein
MFREWIRIGGEKKKMCSPTAVTAAGVLTTWAPMLLSYVVAMVALVSILAVNYRSSLKKLISKA